MGTLVADTLQAYVPPIPPRARTHTHMRRCHTYAGRIAQVRSHDFVDRTTTDDGDPTICIQLNFVLSNLS